MAFNFNGNHPVALITGAARRVGRAIAVDLAAHGYDLVLTYNRSRPEIEATAEACRIAACNSSDRLTQTEPSDEDPEPDRSGRAQAGEIEIALHRVDLADEESIVGLTDWLHHHIRRLDALIHNASHYQSTKWGSITPEEALEHFQVNALAPLLLTQSVHDLLRHSSGCVILFSDIHVLGRPRRNLAAYNLSKAAATELVRSLSRELAPEVRVLGVAPGVVAWPDDTSDDEIREYESRIPLGRSGKPTDASQLVRFLISREAAYLTGEIIRLDGGRSLA